MPWFASQIITPYNPEVVKVLKAEKELEGKVFFIKNNDIPHCKLPNEGLIFCHRLHDVFSEKNGNNGTKTGATWFNDFLPDIDVSLSTTYEDLEHIEELNLVSPDSRLLIALKKISVKFNQKVVFYYGSTDGGFDENNSGWVFYPDGLDKVVNIETFPSPRKVDDFWEYQNGVLNKKLGFVFNTVLSELDVKMEVFDEDKKEFRETTFFEPHTRGFEWKKYQV